MRKLLLLLTLVACAFVVYNRQRLYLRDPLGTVTRDGSRLAEAAVFINYTNDVLLQIGHGPAGAASIDQYVVQHWNLLPSFPAEMRCLRGLVCLAAADRTPAVPLPSATPATMSDRAVSFTDEAHRRVAVSLR